MRRKNPMTYENADYDSRKKCRKCKMSTLLQNVENILDS
jgi:hypothetical protein